MLTVGMQAPNFSLEDTEGNQIQLSDFKGKTVVVYFYPKNNTPGCTLEAQQFRNHLADFKAKNAVVLGITIDTLKRSCNFSDKNELNFPILTDTDGSVCKEYGVWQLKKNYGREYYGIVRTTCIIDGNGIVTKLFENVRVKNHVEEVLAAL